MNENFHNHENFQSNETGAEAKAQDHPEADQQQADILARLSAADPATRFDETKLSSALIEGAVANAVATEAATRNRMRFELDRIGERFAEAYQSRPRFVLGSSLGAVASIAAFSIVGSVALGNHSQSPLFSLSSTTLGVLGGAKMSSDVSLAPGAEMSLARPFVTFHYTAADNLSNDGGSAHVYQIKVVDDPAGFLSKLADYLGVQGAVHKGQYSDLTTDPNETGALNPNTAKSSLSMQTSYTGNWWFNSDGSMIQGCATDAAIKSAATSTTSSSTDATPEATPTSPDQIVTPCQTFNNTAVATLSRAETLDKFIALMKVAGFSFDAQDVDVQTYSLFTTASAQYKLRANGETIDTGLYFSAEWGSDGELASASGNAANIVDAGSFDTISPVEAVARANDPKWSQFTGFGGSAFDMVRSDTTGTGGLIAGAIPETNTGSGQSFGTDQHAGVAANSGSAPVSAPSATAWPSSSATSVPAGPSSDGPSPSMSAHTDPSINPSDLPTADPSVTSEPMPSETDVMPTPPIQEVTIDKVVEQWMQLNDSNGSVWLVYGYRLMSGQNSYCLVPAIADGLIGF